jgi:hypothetical protein
MKAGQLYYKLLPFAAFLFGIWYFCLRILGNHLEYIPGDLGDARFINYLLEHGYQWMKGNIHHFWDAGFMYPFKNTVALSDSMLGTMPLYSAWRFLGFSPETSYQLWWICICTLNYWCGYFVFKKWFNRPDLAAALSWIFAFTIFNLGHLNYMQMIIRFMVPVVFYAAYKMVTTPSVKYFFIYCFGIIWQIYCVFYTGIYLFYFSLLFIFIFYAISKRWSDFLYYFKRENRWHTTAVIAFSIFTLLILVIPYIKISSIVGVVHFGDVKPNLPYFRSYLFPQESSVTWKFLVNLARPDAPAWWLHYMFPGAIPIAALVFAPLILLYNKIKKIDTPLILKSLITQEAPGGRGRILHFISMRQI